MEFHVDISAVNVDRARVETVVWDFDSAAVLQIDEDGQRLRINVSGDARDVLRLLRDTGASVEAERISTVPSTCCGSCSS